jgi:hypothetical protein
MTFGSLRQASSNWLGDLRRGKKSSGSRSCIDNRTWLGAL